MTVSVCAPAVLSFQQVVAYVPTLTDYKVISQDEHGFLVATGTDLQTGHKVKLFQGNDGAVIVPDAKTNRPDLDHIIGSLNNALFDATRAYYCADGQERTRIKTKLNTIQSEVKAIQVALSALNYSEAMKARQANNSQKKQAKTAKMKAA